MAQDDEARPRKGRITRATGGSDEVQYVPTTDPAVFRAIMPTGEPVQVRPGDTLEVDLLAPGQSITTSRDSADGPEPSAS